MTQHKDLQSSPLTNRPLIERTAALKDGTTVLLRSLQEKDEPLIYDMLKSCTHATLHQRFRYSFKLTPKWIASHCQVDAAREIAIVAELSGRGTSQLVGLSRLVFSRHHASAEFGILIADEWQGKGLGALMTRHCLEVARNTGAKRVKAITTPDNRRMITVFRNEGFVLFCDWTNGVVEAHKELVAPAVPSRDSNWEDSPWQRTA